MSTEPSELQLILGDISAAIDSAKASVDYAERSGNLSERMSKRTTLADALHQSGDTASLQEAISLFQTAEQLQLELQPEYPYLYSIGGFRYCSLLLTQGQVVTVVERAMDMLKSSKDDTLLDVALYQLIIGKALSLESYLHQAIEGLRASGYEDYLALGLLVRSQYHRCAQNYPKAYADLQEVYEIAEPSGMRLHLTDYHLEMARLLLAQQETSPNLPLSREEQEAITPFLDKGRAGDGVHHALTHHVNAAEKLINDTGYHRRDKELAELKEQLKML